MGTTREVAERIILREYGVTWKDDNELIDAIDKALQAERERAAKIVNQFSICRDHDQPGHCVECDLRRKTIAAIRGDTLSTPRVLNESA
jgi:hypothetical protein